jgi:hypothetical protein
MGAVSRTLLAGACALILGLCVPAPVAAQANTVTGQELRRWVHVDSVAGTLPALRTSAQRALINEGFGVRAVAACDCLLESGVRSMPNGGSIQLFVHIVKAPTVIRGRISIEAVVRADPTRSAVAAGAADSVLARIGRSFGEARLGNPPR